MTHAISSPFDFFGTFALKSSQREGPKPAKAESDLTDPEAATIAALWRVGRADCDDVAGAIGAATGAGALASVGRLIRCGFVSATEASDRTLPTLALTDKGRALLGDAR